MLLLLWAEHGAAAPDAETGCTACVCGPRLLHVAAAAAAAHSAELIEEARRRMQVTAGGRRDTAIVLEGLLGEGTFGKVYKGERSDAWRVLCAMCCVLCAVHGVLCIVCCVLLGEGTFGKVYKGRWHGSYSDLAAGCGVCVLCGGCLVCCCDVERLAYQLRRPMRFRSSLRERAVHVQEPAWLLGCECTCFLPCDLSPSQAPGRALWWLLRRCCSPPP